MKHPANNQEPRRKKTNESASDKLKSILSSRKTNEQVIQDVSSSSLNKQKKTAENQSKSSKSRITEQLNTENNTQKNEINLYSEDEKDLEKTTTNTRVVSNRRNNGRGHPLFHAFKINSSKEIVKNHPNYRLKATS